MRATRRRASCSRGNTTAGWRGRSRRAGPAFGEEQKLRRHQHALQSRPAPLARTSSRRPASARRIRTNRLALPRRSRAADMPARANPRKIRVGIGHGILRHHLHAAMNRCGWASSPAASRRRSGDGFPAARFRAADLPLRSNPFPGPALCSRRRRSCRPSARWPVHTAEANRAAGFKEVDLTSFGSGVFSAWSDGDGSK